MKIKETIKRNMLIALLKEESIRTTLAKAKIIKCLADRIIHTAKKKDLSTIRSVSKTVKDKNILKKLFSDIAPRFADRIGGYTRVIHAGYRNGDCAPIAILELVDKRIIKKSREEKRKEKEEKKKKLLTSGKK